MNGQRLFEIFLITTTVTAGILFATYHMIAWYGRIGGLCS